MSRTLTACFPVLLVTLLATGGCAVFSSGNDALEQQLAEARSQTEQVRGELSQTQEKLYNTHENWWRVVLELGAVRKASEQEKTLLASRLREATTQLNELKPRALELQRKLEKAVAERDKAAQQADSLKTAHAELMGEKSRFQDLITTQKAQIDALEKKVRPLEIEVTALRKQLAETSRPQ
jgi:chromosome segregation ATPase